MALEERGPKHKHKKSVSLERDCEDSKERRPFSAASSEQGTGLSLPKKPLTHRTVRGALEQARKRKSQTVEIARRGDQGRR